MDAEPQGGVLSGNWWPFAAGPALGGAYKGPDLTSDHFAPVPINCTSATTAARTLPNGRTTNLQRQRF